MARVEERGRSRPGGVTEGGEVHGRGGTEGAMQGG